MILGTELKCEDFDYQLQQNYTTPPLPLVNELKQTNYSFTKQTLACSCATGFPKCPPGSSGDINYRPIFKLRTQDILYDLTSRNMSDWLVKTEFSSQFFRKRFGGFEFQERVATGLNETTLGNLNAIVSSVAQLFNATLDFKATIRSVKFSPIPKVGDIKFCLLILCLSK